MRMRHEEAVRCKDAGKWDRSATGKGLAGKSENRASTLRNSHALQVVRTNTAAEDGADIANLEITDARCPMPDFKIPP